MHFNAAIDIVVVFGIQNNDYDLYIRPYIDAIELHIEQAYCFCLLHSLCVVLYAWFTFDAEHPGNVIILDATDLYNSFVCIVISMFR